MPEIPVKLTRAENAARFHVPVLSTVRINLEEDYLPSVVASEVYESYSRTPMEAKKAQAVAARCFALSCMESGTVMDDTPKYQSFAWRATAGIPESARAVRETAGQVLRCGEQVITAWFCQSNGGACRRSDDAWSAYKPWTARQSDPWDEGGRLKWGNHKPGHGVGMSQVGAAYAASLGFSYQKILSFYYPNTVLTGGVALREVFSGNALYRARVAHVRKALNLRATPDISNNTLLMLKKGALVDVLAECQGEDGAFARVRHSGDEGYCSGVYLTKVEA